MDRLRVAFPAHRKPKFNPNPNLAGRQHQAEPEARLGRHLASGADEGLLPQAPRQLPIAAAIEPHVDAQDGALPPRLPTLPQIASPTRPPTVPRPSRRSLPRCK